MAEAEKEEEPVDIDKIFDLATKYYNQHKNGRLKPLNREGRLILYGIYKQGRGSFHDLTLLPYSPQRCFYGSEHGKGEVDGETGILSQALRRATYQGHNFSCARDMVEYLSRNFGNDRRSDDQSPKVGSFVKLTCQIHKAIKIFYATATEGNCNIPRPGFFDFKARAKWDAWNSAAKYTTTHAKVSYITFMCNADSRWLEIQSQEEYVAKLAAEQAQEQGFSSSAKSSAFQYSGQDE